MNFDNPKLLLIKFFSSHDISVIQRPVDIKNRPRIPIPDEDPYSIAGNGGGSSGSSGFGQSGSSGEVGRVAATRNQLLLQSQQRVINNKRSEKPPKLPPRDSIYPHVLKVLLFLFNKLES